MGWERREESNGAIQPSYEKDSGLFTIKFHHGGVVEYKPHRVYEGGRVSYFDFCHTDLMSLVELRHMVMELGYSVAGNYYCKLDDDVGLELLRENVEVRNLYDYVDHNGVISVYIGHDIDDNLRPRVKHIPSSTVRQPPPSIPSEPIPRVEVIQTPSIVNKNNVLESVQRSKQKGLLVDIQLEGDDSIDKTYDPEEGSEVDDDASSDGSEYYVDSDNDVQDEFASGPTGTQATQRSEADLMDGLRDESDNDDLGSIGSSDESNRESENENQPRVGRKRFNPKFPKFNETSDMGNPTFRVGMEFKDHITFRNALKGYAIKWGKQITFQKSDKMKISAICKEGCPWYIYGSFVKNEQVFRVKTYKEEHNCNRAWEVKHVKAKWIVRTYCERIRLNPTWPINSLRDTISSEHNVAVDEQIVRRAKQKCLQLIEGNAAEQYAQLWGYVDEVKRCNPGTTIKLVLDSQGQPEGTTMFKQFYLCWGAFKQGFLEGCRPLIGVDGCHLKGPHKGVLLTAVGLDANNTIYPIAYAIVASEKRETWEWFLELLGEDLNIVNGARFTFMSDKQKGLIEAVAHLFPEASHRFCVRHMYNNFKKEHRGLVLKELFWKAARASTVAYFTTLMGEIQKVNKEAYNWLVARPAVNWSRSHFDEYPKCDILLNNICESFNSNILAARDKYVITMLENIRVLLMESVRNKREAVSRWTGDICPKVQIRLEKAKVYAAQWLPRWNGIDAAEVVGPMGRQYRVDFREGTCGCRQWQLSGIPCAHVVATINLKGDEPEHYVHTFYKVDQYLRIYQYNISPINGREEWPLTEYATILQPPIVMKRGRKQTARRKEPDELHAPQDPTKVSRKGTIITCTNCKKEGHNRRSCEANGPWSWKYKKQLQTRNNEEGGATEDIGGPTENEAPTGDEGPTGDIGGLDPSDDWFYSTFSQPESQVIQNEPQIQIQKTPQGRGKGQKLPLKRKVAGGKRAPTPKAPKTSTTKGQAETPPSIQPNAMHASTPPSNQRTPTPSHLSVPTATPPTPRKWRDGIFVYTTSQLRDFHGAPRTDFTSRDI